ncbi:GNAT family N-acetyltransferase [Bacillus pseudomycoides]|uniref:GNAT family N-acetyltransferase n=1 Tax=Bacillus pseudomycoides TaxID=64104 RepID=A0AA91V9K8_9BACI|nr:MULTISPECIES: GNAT family N-acetyltransferase [Bacillus]PEB50693.1 GNAT family N-acetyltransferase [Bacillus sp. AFS098217]PED81107.1 GNAT family N-acetyltransferase [Bacillus pseudomycoides]PEU14272.1 GNAT family N-acetyltransferase [Bacillus sp. AFS019443]PEU19844.1 GNAT family N-acetyltransferase [Bacillus sp. AFS014408]PFW57690.1 GNAT family N-acetyltransferase [Bacillus sp. AFS075034]
MNIRLAEVKDIQQLIRMRWDFTIEYDESRKIEQTPFNDFEKKCQSFLENALNSDQWFIWVAEENGEIVSHIYITLIQKVPRPGRITHPFAYMTNVFTIKEYRNKGIGSKLLTTINEWTKENRYEFIIVWPSDDSINYYKKNGYIHCTEPMEYFPS